MATYTNQLEPILSWSFPSNHLTQFSLARELRANETWPSSAKVAHFFFVTIVGGVKTNENEFGKTYDFKNQSYNIKFSIEEIIGLANALKYAAAGQLSNMFGGYQKFARSNNNVKNVYLIEIPPNERNKIRGVGLGYSQQNPNVKLTVSLSADHALAMAEVLLKMGHRAIELELDRMEKLPKSRGSNPGYVDQQTDRRGFESPAPDQNANFEYPSYSQPTPPPPTVNPPSHPMFGGESGNFGNNNPFGDISDDFGNMLGNL